MAFTPKAWVDGQVPNGKLDAAAMTDLETRVTDYTDTQSSTVLLSTTILSTAGTFDVSGIDQSYNDLILMVIARGTDVAASDTLKIRFNNDSGANYDWQQAAFFGTSSSINSQGAAAQINIGSAPSAGGTASYFGMWEIIIPGYASTTWVKRTIQPFSYYSPTVGVPAANIHAGIWRSTAAINRIQMLCNTTANLAIGSQLKIYGRK